MKRNIAYLFVAAGLFQMPALCCDCGPAKPPCVYLAAEAIFLGRVAYTNDDNSGLFTQATLVRFDVQERFRGVAPNVHQIWVDPGSFTSCYEEYHLGEQYLVFATRKRSLPADTAAMALTRDHNGNAKEIPPEFKSSNPPPVYYAPECAGSRPASYPTLERDLAMLRAVRAGAPVPRVLGHVHLFPFYGWPVPSGPLMAGARVTLSNGTANLYTTTDAKGDFSMDRAPSGYYSARAELAPYRMGNDSIIHVPETGCGYTDIQLTTASTVEGVVLDNLGRPARKVRVAALLKEDRAEDSREPYSLKAQTDNNGRFLISGLPDNEFYIVAGETFPHTGSPYSRVYYPHARSATTAVKFRLRPGEHRPSIVLVLDPPLQESHVRIRIRHKDGRAAKGANADAFRSTGDVFQEWARADRSGIASVPCLQGVQYQLRASTVRSFTRPRADLLVSAKVPFVCGKSKPPSAGQFRAKSGPSGNWDASSSIVMLEGREH